MPSIEFDHLVRECKKLFYYGCDVDMRLIEIILLPYVSLAWSQIPVWLRIIAPAACGKSTHMSLLEPYKTSYIIDSFTSKSFISGYRGNNEDPSQLPRMNNKVLMISDESTMMEQRKEERGLIQAILRKAYDGKVTKAFGNLKEKVEHNASFNILVAATPIVDRYYMYNQALGERFINYRLQIPNKRLITEKAVRNQQKNFGLRKKRLSKEFMLYLDSIVTRDFKDIKVKDRDLDRLVDCASFIALIRTHVTRDASGRFVTLLPQPEAASRLVQQMLQVAVGKSHLNNSCPGGKQQMLLLTTPDAYSNYIKNNSTQQCTINYNHIADLVPNVDCIVS